MSVLKTSLKALYVAALVAIMIFPAYLHGFNLGFEAARKEFLGANYISPNQPALKARKYLPPPPKWENDENQPSPDLVKD